jgi:hypothetical protein
MGQSRLEQPRVSDKMTQKGGYQLAHQEPHQGDLTLSSFVSESGLGDFLHAPLWVGI